MISAISCDAIIVFRQKFCVQFTISELSCNFFFLQLYYYVKELRILFYHMKGSQVVFEEFNSFQKVDKHLAEL